MTADQVLAKAAKADEALTKDREIHRLRAELASSKSRVKSLLEELEIADKRLAFADSIDVEPTRDRIKRKLDRTKGESTAVIVLTDWHVGEVIEAEKVNGLNSYNLEECQRRARKAFDKACLMLEWTRGLTRIDNVVIALLGDFISGAIHEELLEEDELSPTESTLFAQDLIVDGIDQIIREMKPKNVIVPCCYGNHGRTTKKLRISTGAENSYEFLMYRQLAKAYRKEAKVSFLATKGYHNYLELHGRKIRFHHGHAIKFGGGIGGISVPVNKKIAQWNKAIPADVDFFGHWHQFINYHKWTSCPCLVGYAPFSNFIGAEPEPPAQLFSVINGDHNKVLAEMLYV